MGLCCMRICVRKSSQNLLKLAKIGKDKKINIMISDACNNLRRLGSPDVVSENPRVAPQAHSILSPGTNKKALSACLMEGLFYGNLRLQSLKFHCQMLKNRPGIDMCI